MTEYLHKTRETKHMNRKLLAFAVALALGLIAPCARGDIPLTTLFSFSGTNGYAPYAKLMQGTDGNFYGTTTYGGTSYNGTPYSGYGTVFMMTPTNTLTNLYSFGNNPDGAYPYAGLMQATNGIFYGTTQSGGYAPYAGGEIFAISNGIPQP